MEAYQGPITGPVCAVPLVHIAAQVPTDGQYDGRGDAHGLGTGACVGAAVGVVWANAVSAIEMRTARVNMMVGVQRMAKFGCSIEAQRFTDRTDRTTDRKPLENRKPLSFSAGVEIKPTCGMKAWSFCAYLGLVSLLTVCSKVEIMDQDKLWSTEAATMKCAHKCYVDRDKQQRLFCMDGCLKEAFIFTSGNKATHMSHIHLYSAPYSKRFL